uniref:Ymf68-like protein n=1 Tax=Paramecium gigas TaxID=2709424 RepID=UPI001D012CFD|nr:Ymf68-like protein [Paramecium gigas]QVG61503.1 Ymf68-like protein [Paramecium gigas]
MLFLKKYSYNKYTEALQRFWKRSFSIFWLLEGFIFAAFIFLTFNASNEVIFSYDPQFFFKLHLFSWRIFIFKLTYNLWILLLIWYLTSKTKRDISDIFILHIISAIIIYLFFIEFCQFFHFLNHSNYSIWTFTFENHELALESDFRKSRISNNYVLICAIAKFWHVIFIFFTWFFFFSKFFESNTSRDYMLATNLQNFLILYLLNLICMYPWIKNMFRFYLNDTFYWFFLDFKNFFFKDFFFEMCSIYFSFFFFY